LRKRTGATNEKWKANMIKDPKPPEGQFTDAEIAHRQFVLDYVMMRERGAQGEIVLRPYHQRSVTVGQGDSDANLHVSPEDQLWGKMK
jgi:hypothetical protein